MDLICPRCTEPWDNDSLHEEAEALGTSYSVVAAEFRTNGCKALEHAFGPQDDCVSANNTRSMASAAMFELLGDDMDGAASLMEDFDYAGMLD